MERFVGYSIALCNVVGKHFEHTRLDLSASSHKGWRARGLYRNAIKMSQKSFQMFLKTKHPLPPFHPRVLQLGYGHHMGVCRAIEVTTNTWIGEGCFHSHTMRESRVTLKYWLWGRMANFRGLNFEDTIGPGDKRILSSGHCSTRIPVNRLFSSAC